MDTLLKDRLGCLTEKKYCIKCPQDKVISYKSGRRGLSIEIKKGETFFLFIIDPENNPNCKLLSTCLQKNLVMERLICDLISYFKDKEIVTLIEIQGNKSASHGIKQILNTLNCLKQLVREYLPNRRFVYKAAFIASGSAIKHKKALN